MSLSSNTGSNTRVLAVAGSIASAIILSACGGGSATTGSTTVTSPPVVTGNNGSTTSTTSGSSGNTGTATTYTAAINAAKNAANTDALCAHDLTGDFYWEIGDANSSTPIASGSTGAASVDAQSHFNIASASKWIFGAYAVEKKGIDKVRSDASLADGLRFMSGYTGMNDDGCVGKTTVAACFNGGMNGKTSEPDPNTVGKFNYDSGHDQKLATVDLGLGNFTAAQIDTEYQNTIGLSRGFNMAALDPLMAGGEFASASDYAQFLRKIMRRELVIGNYLGDNAVCALPSACPGKVGYSPITILNEPWTYSYNHWVESQYGKGSIDAYSSPGKWGFYPWISADKKYYGIVSRHDKDLGAYAVSVKCGRQIRKAFMAAL